MSELRRILKEEIDDNYLYDDEIVCANNVVLSYIETLSYEEFMFAEYGVREDLDLLVCCSY